MSQDREPVGMLLGGLNGDLVGLGILARRMEHRYVDAGCIHLPRRIVLGVDGNLAMGRIGWEAVFPDMDLRVNNQHDVLLLCCDTVHIGHVNTMTCQACSRRGAL